MVTKVDFGLSRHELGREERGVDFNVRQDDEAVGLLRISKGGLRWYPKHNSKINYKLDWQRFGEFMKVNGKKER
jgi:hypothetical protein